MADRVVVIGGGIGGMVAALRARRRGASVQLLEAREQLGGLASPVTVGGMTFDGGPYILLDRRRLGWALDQVGIDLDRVAMQSLDPAYSVEGRDGHRVTVHTDLDRTVEEFNRLQAGSGDRYGAFVRRATRALERLAPLLIEEHSVARFVTSGAWRSAPWTLASLRQLLQLNRLAGPAATATTIWTAIAGGDPAHAPGPMALVPALIHRDGAARPVGGVHRIVSLVESELTRAGVDVVPGAAATRIETNAKGVRGVRLANGETVPADVVISDIGGAAALLDLVDAVPPPGLRWRLRGPLQSPGVAAYLRVRGRAPSEIRFFVEGSPQRARAVVQPDEPDADGWVAGRLIAPLSAAEAARLGPDGQRELLERYVSEGWWRRNPECGDLEVEVVETRLVGDWGRTFRLRDDAMNLVMSRRYMLLGRLPHRIAHVPGLYLTGSWTHPGRCISFCSVSGVLAADAALAGRREGSR